MLCAGVVWLLFKSPAVDEHLSGRPVRRHVPGWVLTARIAVLSYGALTLVPFLVAVGTLFGDRRLPLAATLLLLGAWFALFLVLGFVLPFGSFFIVLGKGWARWLVGTLSLVVLVTQPLLCLALLGRDGLQHLFVGGGAQGHQGLAETLAVAPGPDERLRDDVVGNHVRLHEDLAQTERRR